MASAETVKPAQGDPDVVRVVATGARRSRKIWLLVVILLLLPAAGFVVYRQRAAAAPITRFQTQKVERGTITVSVTAKPALNATIRIIPSAIWPWATAPSSTTSAEGQGIKPAAAPIASRPRTPGSCGW